LAGLLLRQVGAESVIVGLIFFGALAEGGSGDLGNKEQKGTGPPTVKEASLRQELLKRMNEEQQLRESMVGLMAKKGSGAPSDTGEMASTMKKLVEVDARNRARIKEIIDRYGWPGKKLVGEDGSNAAWLLVQHADPDPAFQKRCLGLLAEAVKKKDATPQHLAYLTDRVRIGEKAKQVYGTQFRQFNGKMEPFPIEDEANVDKRRKEVGLPPLAEYRKIMERMYQPKQKDSAGK
jgi:hypothetical protein